VRQGQRIARKYLRWLAWLRRQRSAITLVFTLLVLVVAGVALYELLRDVHFSDVRGAIEAVLLRQILLSMGLAALSYFVLTGYDVLALFAIRKPQRYWRAALASFSAYCFSHNFGFAPITGGAARWRAYHGTNITPADIARIVVIAGVTFWLGIFLMLGIFMVAFPGTLRIHDEPLAYYLQAAIGSIILLGIFAYLIACARQNIPITIFGWTLPVPSLRQALAQFALAATDIALASAALLVLLPEAIWHVYPDFIIAYVVAMVIAMISHAPGGLGVFEAVILVTLPQVDKVSLVSALILYRVIYYWLPLLLAALLLGLHELRRYYVQT